MKEFLSFYIVTILALFAFIFLFTYGDHLMGMDKSCKSNPKKFSAEHFGHE